MDDEFAKRIADAAQNLKRIREEDNRRAAEAFDIRKEKARKITDLLNDVIRPSLQSVVEELKKYDINGNIVSDGAGSNTGAVSLVLSSRSKLTFSHSPGELGIQIVESGAEPRSVNVDTIGEKWVTGTATEFIERALRGPSFRP